MADRSSFMNSFFSFCSAWSFGKSMSGSFLFAVLGLIVLPMRAEIVSAPSSIHDFDQRASAGGAYNVVFFGGSLTWGANASDPQTTSYRGLMMKYLLAKYPKASLFFHDAAIGGTGSDLGLFRIQRDVLAYKPDLVFLDFTVNDGAEETDVVKLAAYEHLLRQLLGSSSAVMPVLMCFKYHFGPPPFSVPPRHQAHLKLAHEYNLPVANVLAYVHEQLLAGKATSDALWPFDLAHPGDLGYQFFFQAVKGAYESAISQAAPQIPAQPVFPDLFPHVERHVLVEGKLPDGWKRVTTYRTSLWFDGLSSRWMGDVAASSGTPASASPLEVSFRGSLVGLFGERNGITPPFKVWIDGKPIAQAKAKPEQGNTWKIDTAVFGGARPDSTNLFAWTLLSTGLQDGDHTLKIDPILSDAAAGAQLRIESICSAGR
jgi:lysophospholipase L1-like esterase